MKGTGYLWVAQPSYAIGRRGAEVLLERIGNAEGAARVERQKSDLRIGESSMHIKSS